MKLFKKNKMCWKEFTFWCFFFSLCFLSGYIGATRPDLLKLISFSPKEIHILISNQKLIPENLRPFIEEETGLRLIIDVESDPKKFQLLADEKNKYDIAMAPLRWLMNLHSGGKLDFFEDQVLTETSINKDFELSEANKYIIPLYWFQTLFITSSQYKSLLSIYEILKQPQIEKLEILDSNLTLDHLLVESTHRESQFFQNWVHDKKHQFKKKDPFNLSLDLNLTHSIEEIPHTQMYKFKNSIAIDEFYGKPWSGIYIWGLAQLKKTTGHRDMNKIVQAMASPIFITKLFSQTPWASTLNSIENSPQIPATRKPSYLRTLKLNTNHVFE